MRIFDLTKEIELPSRLQKKYNQWRVILHFIFLVAMFFVFYRILFPIVPLDFSLNTPNSSKNTLVSPRSSQTNAFPPKGLVKKNDQLLFNANPIGQFAKANFIFAQGKNGNDLTGTSIKIRKSYQAFFYPTGEAAGFKEATLLSTPDGSYYIVSDGLLRRFENTDIILKLGYPKSAFLSVSAQDLKANKPGADITTADNYPDGTLFVIENSFYQLKNQQLFPFVSASAFLSQFEPASAIAKSDDFLSSYALSEKYLGFADGTLASLAESVFILSEDKAYPIENEVTFTAMGFAWDNVIPISSDELGMYQKQKQFTNNAPHPNGTLFVDQKTNNYFLIQNGQKKPLINAAIQTYAKQKPILADSQQAEKEFSCTLKKEILSANTYSCGISLEELTPLIGNDYQIAATFPADANLSTINTTFSTPLTFHSLRNSLSVIKTKLKNR